MPVLRRQALGREAAPAALDRVYLNCVGGGQLAGCPQDEEERRDKGNFP